MTAGTRRFAPGRVVATPGALRVLEATGTPPADLLHRHLTGDWGDMDASDRRQNDEAVRHGDARIFSAYNVGAHRLWIITEADRRSTCILTPEEY